MTLVECLRAEEAFRCRIKELRGARGWSQKRLADEVTAIGVRWYQSTVAGIERGERQVGLTEALATAAVLGLSPASLWSQQDGKDDAGSVVSLRAECDYLRGNNEKLEREVIRLRVLLDRARRVLAETEQS